jgi:hypothetical protein
VRENTIAGDKIFVWDDLNTGAIVLWSQRDNIGNFHEKYAFLPVSLQQYWTPYAQDYRVNQVKITSDLKRNNPKYIVYVWSYGWFDTLGGGAVREMFESEKKAFSGFFEILSLNYELEKTIGSCRIYRRRL